MAKYTFEEIKTLLLEILRVNRRHHKSTDELHVAEQVDNITLARDWDVVLQSLIALTLEMSGYWE